MILLDHLTIRHFKALRDVQLVFPRRASILIEGLNESGKSSLFEAIVLALFGAPLIVEETGGPGRGKTESVITYGQSQATIQLGITIDTVRLEIERTITRSPTRARLAVHAAGGRREIVTGQNEVNERIIQEMGHLTRDAMLNSCFVEQKKLGKLEEMGAADRRASLEYLLNLSHLQRIQRKYKVTDQDQQALRTARQRLALAEIDARLPALEAELVATQRRLDVVQAWALRTDLATNRERHAILEAERVALEAARRDGQAQQARAVALAACGTLVAELRAAIREAEDQARALDQTNFALAQIDHNAEQIPALQGRGRDLVALVAQHNEIAQVSDALRQQRVAAQREVEAIQRQRHEEAVVRDRLAALDDQLAGTPERAAEAAEIVALRQRYQAASERQALERWLAGAADEETQALRHQERAVLETEMGRHRTQLQQHEDAARAALQAGQLRLGAAVGIAFIAILVTALAHQLGLLALILPAGALLWLARGAFAAARKAQAEAQATREMLRIEKRQIDEHEMRDRAWREVGGGERLRAEALRLLRDHDLPAPHDIADARQRLRRLPAANDDPAMLRQTLAEATRTDDARRQQRERLTGERDALRQHLHTLESIRRGGGSASPSPPDGPASPSLPGDSSPPAPDALLAREAVLSSQIAEESARLGIAPRLDAAQQAIGTTRRDLAALQEALTRRPALAAHAATQERAATSARQRGADRWMAIRSQAPGLELPATPILDATTGEQIAQRLQRIGADLDGEAIAQQLSANDTRRGQVAHEQHMLDDEHDRLRGALMTLGIALGLDLDQESLALTENPSQDERQRLEAHATQLKLELYALREQRRKDAADLGLDAATALSVAECAADVAHQQQEVRVRERAYTIVEAVRSRMIAQVLPNTMRNMNLLLPLLTMDRYRECEITEDFKLRIWDDQARRHVAKNIFSGGTRDQFSLALRLAFALATLPEQLGTTPGFIFLDEPLSSFDSPRSEALIALLTRGQVHDNFAQIFVISHSQLFDRQAFTHHLRLEHGEVTESTLPRLAAQSTSPGKAEPEGRPLRNCARSASSPGERAVMRVPHA